MFYSILNMFLPHFGRLITRIFHILINFIRTTAIFPFCKSERAFHLIIFRVKSIIKIIWKCYKVGGFIVYEWTLFVPSSNMTFPEGCGRRHKKVKSWQKQSFSCISKNIVTKMKLRTKYISMSIDSIGTGIWYLSSLINAKSYVESWEISIQWSKYSQSKQCHKAFQNSQFLRLLCTTSSLSLSEPWRCGISVISEIHYVIFSTRE